ncbi:MAG: hybrid sensor histidine kinase/response regulator [Halioglobus sp.]
MHITKNSISVDQQIQIEQIKTLYESIGSLVTINLIVGTALVFVFWDLVSHTLLLTWMGLLFVMLIVRMAVYGSFTRAFNPDSLERYKLFLILGSLSSGIIWGAGGLIMYVPDQLDYQLFILLSLLAMAGGSAFSLSIYLPAYFAFVPVMLTPVMIQLFSIGDTTHAALATVTLIFLIAMTLFNIKVNKSLTSAMSLRFENLELIEELQVQKQEAEHANSAKSKFLAAASHDLRQPLYALTLFTEALRHKATDPESLKITNQITRSVDALQTLFDALLDISVLDAGAVEVHKSNFKLDQVIDKLMPDFNPLAAQKNLSIQWPSKCGIVYSDPNLLERILRNFLTNAIRYTDAGHIQVKCEPTGRTLAIRVVDTGIGISVPDQETIFDEFHQLGNPERDRTKGLGLGLSIVKRTASLLGHGIDVQSQPGLGSTFSVTVDAAPVTETVSGLSKIDDTTLMPEMKRLIMLIDDEEAIREGLQLLLTLWGCDVIACADETEALGKLNSFDRTPDAIICDYRLRDHRNGLDVIAAINSACQTNIPAVVVTGETQKDLLRELSESGHQVLHKPVAPAKLRAFLRSLTV